MLRHNLLIILRGLRRFKRTFIINLVGLSVGLASALLIFLWVNDEVSVDKFHEKDERLYQVMTNVQENGGWNTMVDTNGPLAQVLAEEMPEIEYVATVAPPNWRGFDRFILTVDQQNIKAAGQYAGKDYFNIFSYGLIQGDAGQVLADKHSIIISDELAMKLFNTTQGVVGKTIDLNHEREYLVTGLFKKTPAASSVRFDFVLPFDAYLDVAPWYKSWDNFGPHTYLVLREGTDAGAFNAKIKNFFKVKQNGDDRAPQLLATRYSDNYLHGNFENGVQAGGRIAYVNLFSAIGLFILIIACINFMNLSTAKATVRLKEVGVKKALGAGRKRLAVQFIGESLLMTFLSLVVAIILVVFALPQFNLITGKELSFTFTPQLVAVLTGITLVTGLVAGSYPAIYLSGFNPVAVLKGKLTSSAGEVWVRKGLVAFQFTLSIVLIVAVLVVYKQIEFVQNANLGYVKDNVIYFDVEGSVKENTETFLSEIKKIPGIQNAASTTSDMTGHSWSVGLNWEGKANEDQVRTELMAVNQDFLETLGLEVKQGRFFSRDFGSDTTRVVVNEAAARIMGFEKNAIGQHVNGMQTLEIIGVVKDFHLESFHEEVKPQLFVLHRKNFAPASLIMVRLEAGKEKETIERLDAFYKSYNSGFPLDYTFLDDDYQALYMAEQRVSTLSKYFAGLAILISCLGLFGLAAFTAQRRIKEIGIRKILGASEFGIVRLLSSDFTKTILIAIMIALPLSYFITSKWLAGFVYRIELEWWFFAGTGCLALLIALFTVALQTVRAARVNPTECLKNE